MKTRMFEDFRALFGNANKLIRKRMENGLGDIYVVHLVEQLNYCRAHPNSPKCQ